MCTMERVIYPSCIGVRFVSNLCSCPFQEFGFRPLWRNDNVPCSNWSSVCVFATVLCSIGRSAASEFGLFGASRSLLGTSCDAVHVTTQLQKQRSIFGRKNI